MKFGMPTLLEFTSLEAQIELCKELELDFIEINLNIPLYSPSELTPEYIMSLKKCHQIDFTIHLPEELDVASFIKPIRNATVDYINHVIEWAYKCGIKVITMHLNKGIYFTMPKNKTYMNEQFYFEYLNNLTTNMDKIYAQSSKYGIALCIENTNNFYISHISKSLEVLSERTEFAITWDVGHDAKSDYKESKIINQHLDKIKHFHIHDFNGISDHQALFTGVMDLEKYIAYANKQNISMVIESKTVESLRESVRNLERYRLTLKTY